MVDPLAEFDWPEGAEPADTAPTPGGFAAAKRTGRGLWNAADRAAAPAAPAAGRPRRRAPSAPPDDETADAIVAASWGLPGEDQPAAPAGRRATTADGGPSGGGGGRRAGGGGTGAGAGSDGGPSGGGGGRRGDVGDVAAAVGSDGGPSGGGGGRGAGVGGAAAAVGSDGGPSGGGGGRGAGGGGAAGAVGSDGGSSGGGGGRHAGHGRAAPSRAVGSTGERSAAADSGPPPGRVARPGRSPADRPTSSSTRADGAAEGAWSDDPDPGPAGRRAWSGVAGDERAAGGRGGWRGRRGAAAGVPDRPRTPQEEAELARQICLRQLAGRPRTRAELATALTTRGISAETTADVLDRYDEVGIIDDAAFARAWVTSRHHGRGLARRALADELRRKGVDADTAGEALVDLDESTEAETARQLVDRKLRSTRGTPEQVFRRLVGMLARKGYPPRVAIRAVKDALAARSDEAAEFAEQIDTDALADAQAGLEDEQRARADD